jgi:hypothetical protein
VVDPTPPAPPLTAVIGPKTSAAVTLVWSDGSMDESGYRIERQVGTTWTTVADLPAMNNAVIGFGTSHKVTGLAQDAQHCFRIAPYNSVGASYSPTLCARTTRVTSPNTVVVSDLQGLQGELEDLTPLVYRPTVFGNVAGQIVGGAPAPSFPVPPAQKIVYVADSASIRIPAGALFRLQAGVHLVSGRGGLTRGALLYSDASSPVTMIRVVGDGVRISGLRLRGPSAGTSEDLERALAVHVENVLDFVFDHNECHQWTEGCVKVQHEAGKLTAASAGRVRITENYFHHNQRRNLGYGVIVKDASYAYIDKNTFDWNRHAIASDGGRNVIPDPSYGPEQGYLAYLNVILPGHSDIDYVGGAIEHDTHHMDVHGTESNWYGLDYYDGWAGEFFEVADNSFLDVEGTAFNVRGTPSAWAIFHDNITPLPVPTPGSNQIIGLDGGNSWYGWFAVNEESDRDNVQIYDNIPSVDPRTNLGVGDFDGDGRDDVFLATGRAWYVSYGGVTEWRFLRDSDRTLISLLLGDVDGNGRTDVLAEIGGTLQVIWSGPVGFVAVGATPEVPSQDFYVDGQLVGDFDGDGLDDRLSFAPDDDRVFRITGGNGAEWTSRQQM